MSLKKRFLLWVVKRRIIAAIRKAEKMNPLSKKWAWLGNLGALAACVTSLAGLFPPKYAAIGATIAALINSISHSLPGTGGDPVE